MKTVEKIAQAIQARTNCEQSGNIEWYKRWTDTLEKIAKDILPSGAGIDCGTTIDLDRSKPERLVLVTSYHHMNDGGCYDGWTEHEVIITPSFVGGLAVRITGRDRNQIKDYLADVFSVALSDEYRES